MNIQRRTVTAAFLVLLFSVITSCGGADGPYYSYSVTVINNTDSTITVRYDYDIIFFNYDWQETTTIAQYNYKVIEWGSATMGSERIEVEYQGIKRSYIVSQVGTTTVAREDFIY